MRGRVGPVSSRYSDIGHHHITRDPGIPATPDPAADKLSSSGQVTPFMNNVVVIIRTLLCDASWESTIKGTIDCQDVKWTFWQRAEAVLDLNGVSGCWFWFCPRSLMYKGRHGGLEVSEACARPGGGTLTITISTPGISDMVNLTVDARVLMVNVVTQQAFMSRYDQNCPIWLEAFMIKLSLGTYN